MGRKLWAFCLPNYAPFPKWIQLKIVFARSTDSLPRKQLKRLKFYARAPETCWRFSIFDDEQMSRKIIDAIAVAMGIIGWAEILCCFRILAFPVCVENSKLLKRNFWARESECSSCFACIISNVITSSPVRLTKVNKLNMKILLTFSSARAWIDCARGRKWLPKNCWQMIYDFLWRLLTCDEYFRRMDLLLGKVITTQRLRIIRNGKWKLKMCFGERWMSWESIDCEVGRTKSSNRICV